MDNLTRRVADGSAKKILIVDDNEMLLKFWDRLLGEKHLNYRSYQISKSPSEVLQWMQKTQYELAIIDIVMPQLDGFELAHKAWELNPNMKLVFTTAYECDFHNVSLSTDREELRDVHVLLKPYQDIDKIEEFVIRLSEDDPDLNKTPPVLNESDMRFHLWKL